MDERLQRANERLTRAASRLREAINDLNEAEREQRLAYEEVIEAIRVHSSAGEKHAEG